MNLTDVCWMTIGGIMGGSVGHGAFDPGGGFFQKKPIGLATAVGAVAGALFAPSVASAAMSMTPMSLPSPAPLPAPAPASNGTLLLASGQSDVSVGLTPGLPVTIALPAGASWTSGNNTPPYGTTTPISWTYSGPGTIVLDWVDASGQPQETSITFFNS
jgi:hypothetical protein